MLQVNATDPSRTRAKTPARTRRSGALGRSPDASPTGAGGPLPGLTEKGGTRHPGQGPASIASFGSPPPALDGQPLRVLIADDHRLYRDGLESILAREDGIEVVGRASTGEEAVRLASELRPDLILMDLEMPVMDGVVATRRIRAAQRVRVFLLTSSDSPSVVARARSAG